MSSLNPHQLINLPYAGMAENQLRKQGDWDDPKERLQRALDRIDTTASEIESMADDIRCDITTTIKLLEATT